MKRNHRIYKKYIGNSYELIKLKKWFMLYHHIVILISKNHINEQYINEKLKILNIDYIYKVDVVVFKDIDIKKINNIYYDFIMQYNIYDNNEYFSFNDLENDKLLLLNILEKYFMYIKLVLNYDYSNRFYKQSINALYNKIPKSKIRNIFKMYFYNLDYYYKSFILLFILICILLLLYNFIIEWCMSWLNFYFLTSINIDNTKDYLVFAKFVIRFIIPFILALIILAQYNKPIQKYILPNRLIRFARDVIEKQKIFSLFSLLIAILSLIISVITIFFK